MIFRFEVSVFLCVFAFIICFEEQVMTTTTHVSALLQTSPSSSNLPVVATSRFASFPAVIQNKDNARKNTSCRLKASSNDDDETTDYDQEETLMQIHLVSTYKSTSIAAAKEEISRYTQRFPFAAILPVQPLQYLPAPDGGVEVKFLRKKTKEKGSIDGGIRFFLKEERGGFDVIAKRNSNGQTVSKMFSEKLVILAFIKGISGEETEKTGPPPENVSVESIFHMWL